MALLRYRSSGDAKRAYLTAYFFLSFLCETWLVSAGRSEDHTGLSRVELRSTSMIHREPTKRKGGMFNPRNWRMPRRKPKEGVRSGTGHSQVISGPAASPGSSRAPGGGAGDPFDEHPDMLGLVPDELATPTNHEAARAALMTLYKNVDYEYGDASSNHCASGSWQIPLREDCRAAAHSLRLEFKEAESDEHMPKACYESVGAVWFNPHETGQGNPQAKPVCMKDMQDLADAADKIKEMGRSISIEDTVKHSQNVKYTADELAHTMTDYAGNLSMTPHLAEVTMYNMDKYHGDINRNIQLALEDAHIDGLEKNLSLYYAGKGESSRTHPLDLTEKEARERPRTAPKEFALPKHFDNVLERPHYAPVPLGILSNDQEVELAHERFPHQFANLQAEGFDQHLVASALLLPGIRGDPAKALAHLQAGRAAESRVDNAREVAVVDDLTRAHPNWVPQLKYLVHDMGFDRHLSESALRVSNGDRDQAETYLADNRGEQLRTDREGRHAGEGQFLGAQALGASQDADQDEFGKKGGKGRTLGQSVDSSEDF